MKARSGIAQDPGVPVNPGDSRVHRIWPIDGHFELRHSRDDRRTGTTEAMRTLEDVDGRLQHMDELRIARDHVSVGVASLVALFSLLHERSVLPSLVILGDMTIQGQVPAMPSVAELLQAAMDNGAGRVLLPIENRRHMLEVPPDVVERVDAIYYSDPVTAARKALGLS